MLVIDRLRSTQQRTDARPDDDGAVLVTVVVVMFVGFIIAATIAASVVFTIGSNVDNKDRTQAFIAAESGRDVAVASLTSAITSTGLNCGAVTMSANSIAGAAPTYSYSIRSSEGADRPDAWDAAGVTATCPTPTTKWVVIRSTGTGTDVAQTTIDSVYPWYHGPATQPAGTLAFFEGEFTATKSTYQGDLVIRDDGDYTCNNADGVSIQGDLWVLKGGLSITKDCVITGSVYTRGLIDTKNHKLTVGGDLVSLDGSILLTANDIKIGGDVYAKGTISTKNGSGIVNGSFKTAATVTDHAPADWKRIDGTAVPVLEHQTAPTVSPTLDQVFAATSWIELTNTVPWSTDSTVYTGLCSAAELQTVLTVPGTRAFIDMTSCTGGANPNEITVAPGNFALARDAILYVPATKGMNLDLTGTITKAAGDPQLFIVHADANGSDSKPTCTTGSDKFTATATISVRTMVYSACGITNSMALTMTGQLYMGNLGIHLNGGTFTCTPMEWKPQIGKLSCGVKGSGGIFDPTNTVTRLDNRAYQTER
jgi:cytoskeletal protein CcmA (bactofilin family)